MRFVFAPVFAIVYVAEWQRQGFWFEVLSTAVSTAVLVWFSTNGTAYESVAGYFAVQCAAHLAYLSYLMKRLGAGPAGLLGPAALQVSALALVWSIAHAL